MNPLHPSCAACPALCCRLTAQLVPEDEIPNALVRVAADGTRFMAQREDRTCVALQDNRCTIYEKRPQICRSFEIDGKVCNRTRERAAIGV